MSLKPSFIKGTCYRYVLSLSFLLFFCFRVSAQSYTEDPLSPNAFITKWYFAEWYGNKIDFEGLGSNYEIRFWREGSSEVTTLVGNHTTQINVPEAGDYFISVIPGSGTFYGYQSTLTVPENAWGNYLSKIVQWRSIEWTRLSFKYHQVMDIIATDIPQFASNASMASLFQYCEGIVNANNSISLWDVQLVEDMSYAFANQGAANPDLSNWDVSNVVTMEGMFMNTTSYNAPIFQVTGERLVNTSFMFKNASSFNQPIGDWNIRNVETVQSMFEFADSFNQPITNWNVGNVTNFSSTFNGASSFNQNIGNWDVSKVTTMRDLFNGASSFNQNLNNWDVSAVTNMSRMLSGASNFNQPIETWLLKSNSLDLSTTGMNYENISKTIIGLASVPGQKTGFTLTLGTKEYCTNVSSSLTTLTTPPASGGFGWTVSGGVINSEFICTGSTLAIKLEKFSGEVKNGKVLLTWIATSEANDKGFEVQHSTDGTNFSTIAWQDAKATTQYSLQDENRSTGANYYRLKMIDADGKVHYSSIVHLANANENEILHAYPNSVKNKLYLVGSNIAAIERLEVIDLSGIIRLKTLYTPQGVDFDSVKSGIYILRVFYRNGSFST